MAADEREQVAGFIHMIAKAVTLENQFNKNVLWYPPFSYKSEPAVKTSHQWFLSLHSPDLSMVTCSIPCTHSVISTRPSSGSTLSLPVCPPLLHLTGSFSQSNRVLT